MTLDRTHVRTAERTLGGALPAFLVQRWLRTNGGTFSFHGEEWSLLPIFDDTDRRSISRTAEDIVSQTKSAVEFHGLPTGSVAIAVSQQFAWLVLPYVASERRFDSRVLLWSRDVGELVEVTDSVADLFDP